VNCHTGDELAVEQFTVQDKEKILPGLGDSASKIRRALGESLVSVQEHNSPLQNVTTSSLEALKAYSDGAGANDAGDHKAAIALFQRAIDLDPSFATAYMALGVSYSTIGLNDRGSQYLRKAYELRDRVSGRERLEIETFYADQVTGNVEAARNAYQLWMKVYPNDLVPPTSLANDDTILGDYSDALAIYKKVVVAYPRSPLSYANLAAGYMYLDRLHEVHATAEEARAHNLDPPAMHLILYETEILENDVPGMQRDKAALMGKPGWEDQVLDIASDSAAYIGQFSKARELTADAVDSAERAREKEAAAAYKAEAAVREALVGNVEIAKTQAMAALALSSTKDASAISAIALGLAGEVTESKRIADDLNKQFPEDTVVQFNYLPTIRAAIALRSGDPQKALEALAPAAAYELGSIQGSANFMLYPVYMRAEAYLASHQGVASAAEFRKILNHPGVVLNEPIGALARLGLARAYTISGDTTKAKAAYQDFLALWKDADPGIPIYRQAKAEYAKLRD
jgi:eukaryotic-like serine/threonine-protein kinase